MIERASPVQLRKALEIANLFTKAGIGFVPIPVANGAEFDIWAKKSMEMLAELVSAADGAAPSSAAGTEGGAS